MEHQEVNIVWEKREWLETVGSSKTYAMSGNGDNGKLYTATGTFTDGETEILDIQEIE